MGLKLKALLKSPWVFHLSTGSCNNCDIEILDCLTPRFDIERFGMLLAGSIKHADVLLVTGSCNRKSVIRLKRGRMFKRQGTNANPTTLRVL